MDKHNIKHNSSHRSHHGKIIVFLPVFNNGFAQAWESLQNKAVYIIG